MYRDMDHADVNRRFVSDLIDGGLVGPRVIDLGCGPALIPILLCQAMDERADPAERRSLRVMGIDSCVEMLELAKFELEMAGRIDQIELQQVDLTDPHGLQSEIADTAISNSVLHHLDDPGAAIRLAIQSLRPGGRLFIRDLCRPAESVDVERFVIQYGGPSDSDDSDDDVGGAMTPAQLLRQSLHASLTLAEIRELIQSLGIDPRSVEMTSDRHWTIDCVKP